MCSPSTRTGICGWADGGGLLKLTLDDPAENIVASERFSQGGGPGGGNPPPPFINGGNPQALAFEPGSDRLFYSAANGDFIAVLDRTNLATYVGWDTYPNKRIATITDVCRGNSEEPAYTHNPGDLAFNEHGDLFVGCSGRTPDGTDLLVFPRAALVDISGIVEASTLDQARIGGPSNGGGELVFRPPDYLTVLLDVKPGSEQNTINLSAAGVIPVAILGSATFDALTVDPSTIDLAGASVRLVGKGGKYSCHDTDTNHDGYPDLMCQIDTEGLDIQVGDSVVVVEAATYAGQLVRGEDFIRIVPG